MSKQKAQKAKRPFPTLTTPRLTLRELNMGDVPDFYRILAHPLVLRHYLHIGPRNQEQAEDRLVERINRWHSGRGIRWAITFSDHNQLLGTCGFHNWNKRDRQVELGYELDPAFWRQGIATEAVSKVITYGFETLRLNRIEAWIVKNNLASERVALKSGFQLDGVLRESAFWQGEFQDLKVFSLLAREWQENQT